MSGSINLEQALAQVEQDRELLSSVVAAFVEEAPMLVEQIEAGLEGDLADVVIAAHTLKGNYMILGQEPLRALSAEVELKARSAESNHLAQPASELCARTREIVEQLRGWK